MLFGVVFFVRQTDDDYTNVSYLLVICGRGWSLHVLMQGRCCALFVARFFSLVFFCPHSSPSLARDAQFIDDGVHQPHWYANATVFIVVASFCAVAFAIFLFLKVKAVK